jgi:hypothetical protein
MVRMAPFAATVLAWVLLAAAPVPGLAASCDALPRSALRTRACNPQQECLKAIPKGVADAALAGRRKECERLPTSGLCHGPEAYDPQAECRAQGKR